MLFTAPQGGPLRARTFRQRFFAPAVAKAGPGHLKVTPHKLRHTAASLAIAGGADVNVVQTMLGHKSATLILPGHCFARGGSGDRRGRRQACTARRRCLKTRDPVGAEARR